MDKDQPATPLQQALAKLQALGYVASTVDLPFANLLGIHRAEKQLLLVLATRQRGAVGELARVIREPALWAWLGAGGFFELWAFGTRPARVQYGWREFDRTPLRLNDLPRPS